jgi:hypothetical protein
MPEKTNKKAEEQEPKRKPVGFYLSGNRIYELGYDGTFTYFICYDFSNGGWEKVLEIPITEDLILVPLHDGLIEKGVIHLPTAPEPYGSERDLYDLIKNFIHKYLAVSPFYERLASYYVLFSWVHDRFNTLPYLRALGDYGTGKSRFLQTIGAICYRPVFASGATTVSPIFRLIDRHRGTLIIDEADFRNSDADAEITKILNCGYQAGFPVIRSEPRGNTYEPVAYEVYGPKLIATRKRYKDKALESRCLTEEMDFQMRPDIPHIVPDTIGDEALEIRNRLLQWRFDKYPSISLRHDLISESIEPRLNQVLMPLASIIENETMLDDLREFAERYNKLIVVERGMLVEAEILQTIIDLASKGKRDPSMKEIAEALNEDRDASEKPITPRKVGWTVSNVFKLRQEDRRHVKHLVWDAAKIGKLCEKYGVILEGCEDVRIVSHLCEPPGETHKEQAECEDDPEASHSILTKLTNSQKPHRDKCSACKLCQIGTGTLLCCFDQEIPIGELEHCPMMDAS